MALQKIFLTKAAHQEQVGNSMSTTYCFDPKRSVLTLFWKEEKCFQCTAHLGDAFVVECYGSAPVAKKMKLPHKNADLLMWLCNFSKDCRAHSLEEFERILKVQRQCYDWWNYHEFRVEGDKFRFVLCNRSDCGGVYHIAAYVEEGIDPETVKEALEAYSKIRWIYYPKEFVKKILKDRFGISEEEVKDSYF